MKPRSIFITLVSLILVGGVTAGVVFFLYPRLEGEPPSLIISPELEVIGKKVTLDLVSEDRVAGLKEVRAQLVQEGKTFPLFTETIPAGTKRFEKKLEIDPRSLGLQEGSALLRATATDRSWRHSGNPAVFESKFEIDTRPPSVGVLSRFHYINQGGAGLVVYRAAERLAESGVKVGGIWFPGFPAGGDGYVCFFAVPYDAPPQIPIALVAEDRAGNRSHTTFHSRIKPKKFRSDTIRVSDSFLQRVMPYFMDRYSELKGDLLDVFLQVNSDIRERNGKQIQDLCKNSEPRRMWSGGFHRMANAKPMARFADHRVYFNNGNEIDRRVHLGQDLASLAMSEVNAANGGKVVFAGEIGIYGNTVMLDHGFGVFSMYSHLSRIDVQQGQEVEKAQLLGLTGATGLAGGDHLHLSMLISGVFVNPIEWWDSHWVKDNVEDKLALLDQGHDGDSSASGSQKN